MEFEDIRYEVADGVLQITLNRPDRLNAFTGTMGRELIAAFDRADADDDVRAVIVTGEGRGFCAGADLGGGGETFDSGELQGDGDGVPRDTGGQVSLRIYASTKPVIIIGLLWQLWAMTRYEFLKKCSPKRETYY